MARAAKKQIPAPVDVVGRRVSWWASSGSDKFYGEVARVYFEYAEHPKYPGTSLRVLKKRLSIIIPDGRIFNMSGEHEDLKAMGMVAESADGDE